MKLNKIGGEEETILKHKVKDRDKNHLTHKKPILDTMSQDRIPILWIETKQAMILDLLRKPNFKCIKSTQKIGQSNGCIWVNSRLQAKYIITITCTQNKQTTQCLEVNLNNSRRNIN